MFLKVSISYNQSINVNKYWFVCGARHSEMNKLYIILYLIIIIRRRIIIIQF